MSTRPFRNSKCLILASDTFFPPFLTSPTIQFRWSKHCLNLATQFCNSICFLPWQSVYCGKSKTKLLFRQVLCETHWREENVQLSKSMTKEWNQLLDMKSCSTGNMTGRFSETNWWSPSLPPMSVCSRRRRWPKADWKYHVQIKNFTDVSSTIS